MGLIQQDINKFFGEFEDVYENRHRYNVEWAFKDAQNKFDDFRDEIIDTKLKKKCGFCKSQQQINDDFLKLQDNSSSILKKQKLYSRMFSNMYAFLSIFEFLVSVLLVLAISEISHSGEGFIESKVFSFWVVTTFAFIKVFLERYLVKPQVEELGWKLYSRSVETLKDMTNKFNLQATIDLIDLNDDEILEVA